FRTISACSTLLVALHYSLWHLRAHLSVRQALKPAPVVCMGIVVQLIHRPALRLPECVQFSLAGWDWWLAWWFAVRLLGCLLAWLLLVLPLVDMLRQVPNPFTIRIDNERMVAA